MVETQILPAKRGQIGHIHLNRPLALNSLNLEMCRKSFETLLSWKNDRKISAVVMTAEGEKAFCAGGDVKSLAQKIATSKTQPNEFQYVYDFFKYEYLNDYLIQIFEKPIIANTFGITMGGGIGIMNGASFRIANAGSVYSMPEISIGLYPDVGASYFLNSLPNNAGLYLALTGARLTEEDALGLKLVDFVAENKISNEWLIQKLCELKFQDVSESNHSLIETFFNDLPVKKQSTLPAWVHSHSESFRSLSMAKDVQECLMILESLSHKGQWEADNWERAKSASPLSLAVIMEQMKRAQQLGIRDCFTMEYNMSIRFCEKPDFYEGVRSRLIDKDNQPNWTPSTFITPQEVASHFAHVQVGDRHPFDDNEFGI